jgi:opacity protein-like surface antigen
MHCGRFVGFAKMVTVRIGHDGKRHLAIVLLLLVLCSPICAADPDSPPPLPNTADDSFPHLPALNPEGSSIKWLPLLKESLIFLAIQHSFRVATEPDTRAGLGGPFFSGWARAAGNLHGWADGDAFLINYVGHPMEGAVAGFVFVQNDTKYQRTEFGRNRDFWRSRLRAAGWSWAYSTQFEIGPISEASIGKVQGKFPQQGLVDHVITPAIGMTWMLGEDAIDRFVIKRIESRTDNRAVRILARGLLNPSRSMANILRGEVPWHRDTRGGVAVYLPADDSAAVTITPKYRNERLYAPFELAVQYGYMQVGGGKDTLRCNGGSGDAVFNLSRNIGIETEIGGCKILEPEQDVTGDATWLLAGPRYTFRDLGRWAPYIHARAGVEKLTTETMYPDRKTSVFGQKTPDADRHELHSQYTSQTDLSAVAVQFGGGVDYTVNGALSLKIANLEYLHDYNGGGAQRGFRFTTGLVLKMGTW